MSVAGLIPFYDAKSSPSPSASSHDDDIEQSWRDRELSLIRFRRFRANWDGNGADAPDPQLIDTAIRFLRTLWMRNWSDPPNIVALSPEGAVSIAWQYGKSFTEAEIVKADTVEWMMVRPGVRPDFWTESLSIGALEDTWEANKANKEIAGDVAAFV
jgi:hypothetical protein